MMHIHLVGIGGTGLSAIARVLLESGYTVSGSDMQDSVLAQAVQKAGAKVFIGHAAENITGADQIVRSSAIPDDNIEVQQAQKSGIPVLKRAEFLGQLMEERDCIAVAGTHGKTTTSAMIAWTLYKLGQDPSFIVGGVINELMTNARSGQGSSFVIEADEYDRMFLGLKPQVAVITNIEYDHPDIYPSPEEFHKAFQDFMYCIRSDGLLLLCGEDAAALKLKSAAQKTGIKTLTYGIRNPDVDYEAKNVYPIPGSGFSFDLLTADDQKGRTIQLKVPGEYNVLNALAAAAVVDQLGLGLQEAAKALSEFPGTGRRFDELGEAGGVIVVDDYAHHPSEIRATLAAAKDRYPDRELWAVWQPHTYSRTQALFDAFTTSFEKADHIIVSEVYRSREPLDPSFSAQQVVQAMPGKDVYFIPALKDIPGFLLKHLKPNDVLLVFSAGDADWISKQVFDGLIQKNKK
jgi:UDP-N-acetylmuramate--alanine ligase